MSPNATGRRARLTLTALECRTNPAALDPTGPYALGSDAGEVGTATLYDADGEVVFAVTPYGEEFTGGVRVALADVTGDGVGDLTTTPGAGIDAEVKVYDGETQEEVASFAAYEAGFTGGAYVAAADLTGDGLAEVVTGADQGGGPRVRVFDGATVADEEPTALADFLAIEDENFRGGIRLALGDINGDDVADLIVGAGHGGGPRIAAFDGAQLGEGDVVKLFADFFAFEPGLRNGCTVSVGDVDGDGEGDLVFGGGPGGAPRIRVADGEAVLEAGGGGSLDDIVGAEIANFFAGDAASREGVQVGVVEAEDGSADVVGLDLETNTVTVFDEDGEAVATVETDDDDPRPAFFGCMVDDDDEEETESEDDTDDTATVTTATTAEAALEEEVGPTRRRFRR